MPHKRAASVLSPRVSGAEFLEKSSVARDQEWFGFGMPLLVGLTVSQRLLHFGDTPMSLCEGTGSELQRFAKISFSGSSFAGVRENFSQHNSGTSEVDVFLVQHPLLNPEHVIDRFPGLAVIAALAVDISEVNPRETSFRAVLPDGGCCRDRREAISTR